MTDDKTVPIIDKAEIRLLWDSNYWDGPLSGMALYQGRKHAFDMASDREWEHENPDDEDDIGGISKPRMYHLYHLSDEEIEIETNRHRIFEEYCGRHTSYDENGAHFPKSKMREDWRDYWKLDLPKVQLQPSAIVGIFSE